MDMKFCSTTAFALHRVPPVVLAMIDDPIDLATRGGRYRFLACERPLGLLDKPLHVLSDTREGRFCTDNLVGHVCGLHPELGDFTGLGSEMHVASPALTLFTMALKVDVITLAMAMSELCGTFAVCPLNPTLRAQLDSLIEARSLPELDGWRPVLDRSGRTTDLWRRPPLVTRSELQAFSERARGRKGYKSFVQALGLMCENAASPLEVQAAMKLGLSRRVGGEGVSPIYLNERIDLIRSARLMADKTYCVADLLMHSRDGSRSVIVECQSKLMHDNAESALSDATRLAALQSMGYTVIPITYEQLSDRRVFEQIASYILRELGERRIPKTERLVGRERELNAKLFIDWATLA